MADKEFEWLTNDICKEFMRRARELSGQESDTGAMRELRIELQKRCNIPEVWAYNILRGRNCVDYVQYCGMLSGAIPMTEAMKKRLEQERKKEEKKSREKIMEEMEQRIAFLETLTGEKDDEFGYEEKD